MRVFLLLFFILASKNVQAQKDTIHLISWNIKDFGKTKKSGALRRIAEIVQKADILVLQEVVAGYGGAQAVAKLSDQLNRMGAKWDYIVSDPTDSPPYMTERYAYIWKTKHIKIKNRGRLLRELHRSIDREPFLIDFYLNKKKFSIINFHSRPYRKNPIPEIKALTEFITTSFQGPLILAGDFNTEERNAVFDNLKKGGYTPSFYNQKTTLKRNCQQGAPYRNYAIDHIFYSKKINKIAGGIIDYVRFCENLSHARVLSDHLPVFLKFGLK
ncbi:endonuclease/exonuclease/phosphatase family protein [Spongiimicrobium salis]|uniref:endonuclease/exonuclease/phosphatase family protein n=1 Tax=Spongiimicrobium salis TaxID=1667022 RepID=UPI00374CB156